MTDATTTESIATSQTPTDHPTLNTVCDRLGALTDRVEELEAQLERKDDRIEDLKDTVQRQDALLDALRRRTGDTREMVTKLQSRELEKNAHLLWDNGDSNIDTLAIETDRLEKFTKDDGEVYVRIPGGEAPLNYVPRNV